MRLHRLWLPGALALGIGSCAPRQIPADSPPPPRVARAELHEPGGRVVARAFVELAGDSLRVRVEAAGLAPGVYGTHLHAVGRCDPPAFASAGPHWNPTGRQHGKDNPQGMHMGDLPNLMVGADGKGGFEYSIAGGGFYAGAPAILFDADGTAVVVHAQPDDLRTDPSGNSGARIACGVLTPG